MKVLSTFLGVILFSAAMADKEKELNTADAWLEKNSLNRYGDEEGMMYMGGSPLFNESTGIQKDRLEHLVEKFPNKPWEGAEQAGGANDL